MERALDPHGEEREAKKPGISFAERQSERHFAFPTYQVLDLSEMFEQCEGNLLRLVRTVMEVEAPLAEEWILRRIAPLYGRDKVTSVIIREFEQAMQTCERVGIVRRDGFLYVQGREIPMLRVPSTEDEAPREVKYIAPEELAKGIKELLRQNVSAEKAGLFRLLAQRLGFSRVGDAIREHFDQALLLLAREIEINDGMLSLVTE